MASKLANSAWVKKYAPEHVKDIVLPAQFRQYFDNVLKEGMSNSILLYSTPGTGKTTIAKALANDLNAETMYINASADNGIAIAREQIADFARTRSLKKGLKIVILDEADGTTPAFQAAMRGYIEEFYGTCRFIFTCNYLSKIIDALQDGRTDVFNFNMSDEKYKPELKQSMRKRLVGILKHESIEFDESVIMPFIDAYYPSLRTMIAVLQKYSRIYGKIDEGILSFKYVGDELSKKIEEKDLEGARNYINANGYSYTDVFTYLFNEYVPTLENKYKCQAILLLAKYETDCGSSSMPDLQVAACLLELMLLK